MPEYVIGIDGVQDAKDFGEVSLQIICFVVLLLLLYSQVGWGQFAFSLFQIMIGTGMVCLGYIYL